MLFAIAVCPSLLVCVVLLILYFLIKAYQRTEFWAPRQQTPVRGSAQEESCRVLIGEEANVGPSEAQSIPHNHRTPREHDERQSKNISFFFNFLIFIFSRLFNVMRLCKNPSWSRRIFASTSCGIFSSNEFSTVLLIEPGRHFQ